MEPFTRKQQKDLKVLVSFVQTYCQARHGKGTTDKHAVALPGEVRAYFKHDIHLCGECAFLVAHAIEKLHKCPLDPKPSCKKCHIHCYSKENREKIREVMAFSGKHMILRGRLDLLWHYFL